MNWREEQIKVYDEIVEKSKTGHQYIYTEDTPEMLNNIIPKRGKILDLGCGTGHVAELLSDREWYGVDISPKSVEKARAFYNEVKVGDITKKIPYPDDYFDYVLLLATLHHVYKCIPETIKEAKRVLKKGGEIIIIDHDDRNTQQRLMHHGILRIVPCKYEKALNIDKIISILWRNRFEIRKYKEIKTHADQQALKPPFLVRLIKVPLLILASKFGTKTKGDFLIKARLKDDKR